MYSFLFLISSGRLWSRSPVSRFFSVTGIYVVTFGATLVAYCRHQGRELLQPFSLETVPGLVLLNIMLQTFDGLATYHGLMLDVEEGNPMMRAAMGQWGVTEALLGTKGAACLALPLFLFLRHRRLSVWALALIAGFYLALSFVPWLTIFLTEAKRTWV